MHDEHDKAEAGIHPGWHRLNALLKKNALSRRRFLPAAAAAAGTALWPSLLLGGQPRQAAQSLPDQASWQSNNKIKHVVILCQENRSFDHYFGAFAASLGKAGNRPTGFGPHLAYKDSTGQSFPPSRLTQFCNEDPDHGWEGSHAKWNGGKMDGWVAAEDGSTRAIGYF